MSKSIKCQIRNRLVAHTPEEGVRQRLITKMVQELGFPKGLISVEKGLGSRRFDLLCYTRETTPLLLIECKADKIDQKAIDQVFGYNESIRAPFLCLASETEVKTMWVEQGVVCFVSFIPFFKALHEKYLLSKRGPLLNRL